MVEKQLLHSRKPLEILSFLFTATKMHLVMIVAKKAALYHSKERSEIVCMHIKPTY